MKWHGLAGRPMSIAIDVRLVSLNRLSSAGIHGCLSGPDSRRPGLAPDPVALPATRPTLARGDRDTSRDCALERRRGLVLVSSVPRHARPLADARWRGRGTPIALDSAVSRC